MAIGRFLRIAGESVKRPPLMRSRSRTFIEETDLASQITLSTVAGAIYISTLRYQFSDFIERS
jgi:hypothetical protein